MAKQWNRCCVCGYDYHTFMLDTYEMQIDGASDMCKSCLRTMVDEKFNTKEEDSNKEN